MNTKFPIDAAAAKRQIETDYMLREVPKHSGRTLHDPRWLFFKALENRDKQYYVLVRGAPGKDPRFDNSLEYLGNFDKMVDNQRGPNLQSEYTNYTIWFKNAGPMTSRINENDELYYSTEEEYEEEDEEEDEEDEVDRTIRQTEADRISNERIAAEEARRQAEMDRARRHFVSPRQLERPENCNSFGRNPLPCNNRKDYINQTLFFHPDKNFGCLVEAAKKMEQLNVLCNNVTGGRNQHKKKTRKYLKKNTKTKNTKTKNTKTKNRRLKYKKV